MSVALAIVIGLLAGLLVGAVLVATALLFRYRRRLAEADSLGQLRQLVEPLKQLVEGYDRKLAEIERQRQQDFGGLNAVMQQLRNETAALSTLLRNPQARGRWGEVQLRRVIELSGMSEHCDFLEQPSVDKADEQGRLRPDVLVKLPGDRHVVIDAKVPLDAYQQLLQAGDEQSRKRAMAAHAAAVRKHVQQLASKSYQAQFGRSPDFVVLFIAGEAFFRAAIEADWKLLDDSLAQRVILASPITLVAILRAVERSWREHDVASQYRQVAACGKDLLERLRVFLSHIAQIGGSLEKACRSYNEAVGSLQLRVLPAARKMNELGVPVRGELEQIQPVQTPLRRPPSADGDG